MDQVVGHPYARGDDTTASESDRIVRHFREILLWPVRIVGDGGDARSLVTRLIAPGSAWKIHSDEFEDPVEFRERHYHELVTFLPPVRRFIYGDGAASGSDGISATDVVRRTDIAQVRVTLPDVAQPVVLDIAHIDLHIFSDIDLAMLNIELTASDIPLKLAQDIMFQFGRLYPSRWHSDGQPADCPMKVEWLGPAGNVVAFSDLADRAKYLKHVCLNRTPLVASHWDFLFSPLTQSGVEAGKTGFKYKLLEGDRLPLMAFLGMADGRPLPRGDYVRLAYASGSGNSGALPFAERHLEKFENRFCYDRLDERRDGREPVRLRYMSSDTAFVVVGKWTEEAVNCPERGYLGQFRHQQFLLFMIAQFQKAALLMFSDRLAGAVYKLDITQPKAVLDFRSAIRLELERFLRFTHRYWFHTVSANELDRDLFALSRRHLELDRLYEDVRAEIEEMSQFLETEALRRQNESMMRLTVVTIVGLIWTIVTGFLGMNLFDYTALTSGQKLTAFLIVLLPVVLIMVVTVVGSRRLSELLDWLSGTPKFPPGLKRGPK